MEKTQERTVQQPAASGAAAPNPLARLLAVMLKLGGALTVDEVAHTVLEEGAAALEAQGAALLLVEDESLRTIAARGFDATYADRFSVVPLTAELPVAEVARSGELLFVGSVDERDEWWPRLREAGTSTRSFAAIPVAAGRDAPIGVLALSFSSERHFNGEDADLLLGVARLCAQALERARLFEQIEARAMAAQVLAHIGDGVFLVDPNGRVALWNRAAESITGLKAIEIVGRRADEGVPGWSTIADRVPVTLLPNSGSMTLQTLPLPNVSGGEVWIAISGVSFPGGTVYAFRDVTDEREVDRMKSDFVATVSHELRTPLASVYGAALTLQRSDMPISPEVHDQLIGIIASESSRLASIINDILLASHIDSGRIQLLHQPFDAAELVRSVIDSTDTRINADIRVEFAGSGNEEAIELVGDHDRFRQVVVNLVENAIKYSPDGGVVEVGLEPDGEDCAHLWVRDQGIGIPAREHERIFEKFYRLDPNQTRGVGGTGLGLYICRELILRLGGSISVESEEGIGSTFHVRLPRVATSADLATA